MSGPINLMGGLSLAGTGSVNLNASNLMTSAGTLISQDLTSGLIGASLATGYQFVGNAAPGLFTQTGGTNSISNNLYLGYNLTASGSYSLGGGGSLSAGNEYVGVSGTGVFSNNASSNTSSNALYIGYNVSSSGSYALSNGTLTAGSLYVGYAGSGSFSQAGGNSTVGSLYVGNSPQACGSYVLNGGQLTASSQTIGGSGIGSFTLASGTDTIGGSLYLGSGGSGAYTLGANSVLMAGSEYIGNGGQALFQQQGGTNSAGVMNIGDGGRYLLSSGSVALAGYISSGTLDGGNGAGTISFAASAIYDISQQGTFVNTASTTVTVGQNALLIVAPSTSFGSYGGSGLVHVAGTMLVVPAGQGFVGNGTLADPINCQGSITTNGGAYTITNGLTLSGNAYVNLDPNNGQLTTNDTFSGMSGGTLVDAYHWVGYFTGTGVFTQSGGSNFPGYIAVGYGNYGNGTYVLSGGILQTTYDEYVARAGTGTFTQSGGTNATGVSSNLYIGYEAASIGTYGLSAGMLSTSAIWLGDFGNGNFVQSGGTSFVTGALNIGVARTGLGAYNLSAGMLYSPMETVGVSGSGSFLQSGGTNSASTSITIGSASLVYSSFSFPSVGSYTSTVAPWQQAV